MTKIPSHPFDKAKRKERLLDNIRPDLRNCKSVLYVGAKLARADLLEIFTGMQITILEIWPPFVNEMRLALNKRDKHPVFHRLGNSRVEIIQGDIRTAVLPQKYDVGFWWHGPEHVRANELPGALANLEAHTTRLIVLGLPWGHYEQVDETNPFNKHVSHLQPKFFLKFGYSVEVQGIQGKGSNMMCIKRLKPATPASSSSS